MKKAGIWVKAFRLRTLPLSFSTILTGTALALAEDKWNSVVFILALLCTLFLQVLSNLANDYGDHIKGTDNENRIGPQRALQSGSLTVQAMKKAIGVFVVLSLFSGITLIYFATKELGIKVAVLFLVLGIFSIAAAIFYTVGKKAYGYSGLGDVFVFLFFGLIGVGGSYYLIAGRFDLTLIFPASAIGLLSTAVLNMNNMRDHENDRAAGKNTVVVKMGFETARVYHFILMILPFCFIVIWTLLHYSHPAQFLFLLISPLFFSNIKNVMICNNPSNLDPELKKIALGTFVFSLLFLTGQLF